MSSATEQSSKLADSTAGVTCEIEDTGDGYQIVVHKRFGPETGIIVIASLAPDAFVSYSFRKPGGSYTSGLVQVDVTDGQEREELQHIFVTGELPDWAAAPAVTPDHLDDSRAPMNTTNPNKVT